jgi:uncharacterized membrane protein YcaP (DUF421 family)
MDKAWFTTSWSTAAAISLTAAGVYLAVIIYTRIFGKRSFSKMSSFDFAMTVAVGSLIATTVLSKSTSLLDGVVGLFVVYLLQLSLGFLRRFDWIRKWVDNRPLLLMKGEQILYDNLRIARVEKADLIAKLREANVLQLSEVKYVIFETTGDISVIHSDSEEKVDEILLENVIDGSN